MTRLLRRLTVTGMASCLSWAMLGSTLYAQSATPAPSPASSAPTPTLEQRVAGLEAYVTNGDPTAPLKDKDGNIPKDLTMATIGTPGPGHNGWMMTASALVLFMTLPGLALFYGGLVRKKNVLSVLAQCLGTAGLVTVLWWAFGYSLVFGKNFNNPFFGGSEYFFLQGVNSIPNADYGYWFSQNVYAMYQLMFAIITPALIVGAIAERMKYWAIMTFIGIWMLSFRRTHSWRQLWQPPLAHSPGP
jgi:Amt family ammonium transporter